MPARRWFEVDRARLARIRNFQSTEFYSRLVMRPLSVLIMLVVADWKWLTPNRVTTAATAAKIVGVVYLVVDHREHALAAVIWLQVGTLLDHLDGTLARYRGTGSAFGAFYDKVSDALTWLAISGAIGLAGYRDHGDVWLPIAAMASAYALLALGYMKWIVMAASRRSPAMAPSGPPERTPAQWVRWFLSTLARAAMFEEIDLFFWIGIGVLAHRIDLLIWLLAISQGAQLAIMLVKRTLQMRALDQAAASAPSAPSAAPPAPPKSRRAA
ncbi:MAG: CDP-alcohol phosphatidyltransferase family protein [Myxococcales bacterium]|nr:CDP-alcohol phosphatidyltransferase family protein [Myxococcales bacterium]